MKYVKKTFKEFIEWHNREGSERRVGGGDGRKSFDKELGESDDGLKAKSEKSGISLGILKQVYSRGMAAYKTGHRPGTTAQQWAFARVNSFITKGKGTWGGADKDLAAKAGGSAKKESMSGAETPPFKSTAGAGEFGTKELELKYRKETPGQSKNKDLGEAKSARARKADSKKAVKTLKDIRKGKYPGVKMANEQLPITEGALGKQWANGAKRVKSGSITLVKAKNPDADLHTVMKNGKKVGTFVFDDGPDAFSVTNISTKKVSWADQIDDIPKMFESKAPALKSSDYAKGTYQSAQAFKDKFAKKKKESVDEASKEGTVRIIDLGNKGQDKIRKELGVDKLPNKGFQVQVMTKGKFVNQGKPYKTMKDAEKVRSTGQHSMQFDEAALEEKTKWKMGDGRPRNGARIENDRFWNLPYDSLKYIAKDAGEAMKANPTARKATTGPGNWADQVADAATVMQWRKKNGIRESVELDEAIDFRKAHQEIMAYAKKSGGIDKTDFEKVAYYVKAIGDNQNTPNVANKAFMAMKKHIADMDTDPRDGVMLMLKKHGMFKNGRLVQESIEEAKAPGKLGPNASREDKINHTMKIMKMYPANKGKSEKELRKGATDYIDQVKIKNKKTDAYIAKMKAKKESVDEAALEEKTKWKMGDGRPRNGARIENDRFWNLPYDSLKYIAKDAGEAMKANPTARKATTGPGNWADQVADAATVMQWRKKNGIKESKKFSDLR